MQYKFIALQGMANCALQVLLALGAQVHIFGVKTEIVRAALLAGVHGGFGVLDQFHRVATVIGVDADAQARGDAQVMPGHMPRRADGPEHFVGDVLGLLRVLDVVEHDHKLIGTVAKHRIGVAHRCHQAVADLLQHFVAHRIAQGIVDAFETVEADEHHRQLRVVPPAKGNSLGQTVPQQRAVGQLGQRVVLQQVRDFQQFLHPFFDGALQAAHLAGHVLSQLPFPRQRTGHLADLQVVERLFQDQQLVVVLQPCLDGLEGIVGIRRAQRDLQVGVDVPQLFDGLQAIPAGRHAHIDKHHGIGGVGGQGLAHQCQRFLALVGRIQLEHLAGSSGGAEQGFLKAIQRRLGVGVGAQDLAEILVDRRSIVDDQNAAVGPS